MRVRIITPRKRVFDGEAKFVEFKTIEGAMGTLRNRSPLLAALSISELEIEFPNGERETFAVHGGVAEFSNDTFTILSDMAERADEIDIERTRQALEKARLELAEAKDEKHKKEVEGVIQRATVRLKVAKKKK